MTKAKSRKLGKNSGKRAETKAPKRSERTGAPKQRHVVGARDGPFIILFEQDRTDEPDDRVLVWEDADHFVVPLDLAAETLERIDRVQLGAMSGREGHVGEYVVSASSRRPAAAVWAQPIDDTAPLALAVSASS
jgi:hypothetical protein